MHNAYSPHYWKLSLPHSILKILQIWNEHEGNFEKILNMKTAVFKKTKMLFLKHILCFADLILLGLNEYS